jgi:hypothetical protein
MLKPLMIDEKVNGIIDVEALIMTTLLLVEQDRMVTDLPARGRARRLFSPEPLGLLPSAVP